MKVMLIIRDGWGHGKHDKGNAIFHAKTPNHDFYTKHFPTTVLQCTGNAVGNPEGVQGGSEVGHLTIGAGRIVWQPYELINRAINDGSFFKNKELISAIEHCKKKNSNLHLNGLFSTEGVHADYKHMLAILDLCKKLNFDRVFLHLCLDGRDMPEKSALPLVQKTEAYMKKLGIGKIVSVIGRYYGMDRDTNWDRTRKQYDVMIDGSGFKAKSAKEAIEMAYKRGDKTDYYVQATAIVDETNSPLALVKDDDSFIWYSFRSDRARQITAMMNHLAYCPWKPSQKIDIHYVCMCGYDSNWTLPIAFPQQKVKNNLGQTLSEHGMSQLRIAETEKYAHVTFFFNSQIEPPYEGEDRIMVHSPKVQSYDMQPEMSAKEINETLLPKIGKYEFILVNYANPDLVGHSGVFKAVVSACEVVDKCSGEVVKKALKEGYVILLMADHGNADHMFYKDGVVDPSHGLNPVLCTLISNYEQLKKIKLKEGKGQKDVAATVLKLLDIKKPKEMTGESLF
ncbi:MAG: 2,3-bisphosphoglycerate-independent phosphoglycerate mutase [Nanoarchaeota archaeon]